jgi:seryl-tRNA synthetase
MLDVNDFITERGGNPEKIRESQRRRNAPVEAVDEVIKLYEDHRAAQFQVQKIGTKINEVQKQIGAKKKAKENADDFLKEKADLEKEKKDLIATAAGKDDLLKKKLHTIGNYVHDSVPVNNDEVRSSEWF